MVEDDSIEKEFLNFLQKNGSDKGVVKDDNKSAEHALLTVSNSSSGRRCDPPGRASNHGSKKHGEQMNKSLSKRDLKVETVNDFFADFEEAEFAVDWDGPDQQDGSNNNEGGDERPAERKARLARSRRLGPGDRRKEINRRNSSRRLISDGGGSNHGGNSSGDDDGFKMNTSHRGLNRRASNRSLMSNESGGSGKERLVERSNSRKDLMNRRPSNRSLMSNGSGGSGKDKLMEKTHSKKNLVTDKPTTSSGDFFPDFEEACTSSAKTTVKSLRDDITETKKDFDMSFGDLPKDWQVSSNAAAASFLPSTQQRASHRTKSNNSNPRLRRNSLTSAVRPQPTRRSSSRGGAASMNPDGPGTVVSPTAEPTRRTPRRHSLMDDYHGGEGVHRQRSTRGLGDSSHDTPTTTTTTGGPRRTTTIPRRGSAGANCVEMVTHRPSNSTNQCSSATLTGETIAAMGGGATIRW